MITEIHLQNFRSYKDGSFEFEPGVNIIVGPNASGKTNLLEALMVTALGKSFRAKDAELVMAGQDWLRLEAHTPSGKRIVKLQQGKKTYEIDDQKLTRLSLHKTVPLVVFEPAHLLFLSGAPELRREYIDGLLEQTVSGYGTLLKQYRRALSQRNALLKKGEHIAAQQLFAWDVRLSELGSQLVRYRQELIARLNEKAPNIYAELAHKPSQLEFRYSNETAPEQYASAMLSQLKARQPLDFIRGYTSVGPHRDDLQVLLNDMSQIQTASRGETRTILLTLKVLELQLLEVVHDAKPLLLLDDVFSELDGARRRALTAFLKDYQTFITTTDADLVIENFTQYHTIAMG